MWEIPENPPLVGYRSSLTDDPSGPVSPLPDWMPSGWESREYPAIDDVEACRQWLENKRRYFMGIKTDHLQYMVEGVELSVVRDAYRLVKHLHIKKGWPNPPTEPLTKYVSTNKSIDVYQKIAAELTRVRDWINESLSINRQDNQKKTSPRLPDTPDVRDLCRLLQKRTKSESSLISIAREFTGEKPGSDSRAKSLLRQARRYRHLWESGHD